MRLRSLALGAWLSASLIAPAVSAVAAERLPLNIGGVVTAQKDGGLTFGWPGVYFEGRFEGSAVEVAVDAPAEHLAVLVDGQVKAQLRKPGQARLSFTGLGAGPHVVRLEKQTESQTGSARFLGFFAGPGAKPLPAVARPRRIAFIGDSHTVGYGVLSASHDCTPEQVHDLTDTSFAFGPVLAKRLDADYRIIAFSGRGVVRNYDATSPGEPLPVLFPRAIPGDRASRADPADSWAPQWVVIGLGTNDFSTPLKPGEPWADAAALHAAYRDGYVGFIQKLSAQWPGARFLLIAGDDFAEDVQAVSVRINAATPQLTQPVRITGMARTACHAHPSIADEAMMADRLEAAIE